MLHYVTIFISIILFSGLLTAQDLSGLDFISVRVTASGEVKDDLRTSQIKTDVELKLRLVGIIVIDKFTDALADYLVAINGIKFNEDKIFVANINICVFETVFCAWRLEDKPYIASTYVISNVTKGATKDMNNSIRNLVKDLTDVFINDYLADNPK